MTGGDDWRLRGQEPWLAGVELCFRPWRGDDHDHCEFCWAKFSRRTGDLHRGWCTVDGERWICETCFGDFRDRFEWSGRSD